MDAPDAERVRARLSSLVLNFEHDLWTTILLWPVDPDLAAHNHDRLDNLLLPPIALPKEDVLAVVVRVSKLVRVCKTLYNRYREKNRHHWQQRVLLHFKCMSNTAPCLTWTASSNALCGAPPMRYIGPCDTVPLIICNVRMSKERATLVDARASFPQDEERVRHRKYFRREIGFEYDVVVSRPLVKWTDVELEATSYAVLEWEDAAQRAAFARGRHHMPFKAADIRLVSAVTDVVGKGCAGYSHDLAIVPTLPDGPKQYRTMFWVACFIRIEMKMKIPGGAVTMAGSVSQASCGLTGSNRLSKWRDVIDRGESVPSETVTAFVDWDSIVYAADPVRPQLPNVRVFLPPVGASGGVKRQAVGQGRGNFDSDED